MMRVWPKSAYAATIDILVGAYIWAAERRAR